MQSSIVSPALRLSKRTLGSSLLFSAALALVLISPVVPGAARAIFGIWIMIVPGYGVFSLLGFERSDIAFRAAATFTLSVVSLIGLALLFYVTGLRLSAWAFAIGADAVGIVTYSLAQALVAQHQAPSEGD